MKTVIAALGALMLVACGDPASKEGNAGTPAPSNSSSPNSSSPNSVDTTPVSETSCLTRCAAVGTRCSAPAEEVEHGCALVCSEARTEAELACMEASSCEDIASGAAQVCMSDGGGDDNSSQSNEGADLGERCGCDPNPQYQGELVYAYCEGTTNGCRYEFSDEPQLGCLYDYESGEGTCVYRCAIGESESSCPADLTCGDSGLASITGDTWHTCD